MRTLVIGGTRFVGAAMVEALRARGAQLTLFTRGETNRGMFAELDNVYGDRTTELGRLGERRFDLIVDCCGYQPEQVAPAAELARRQGALYLFVSTVSVYQLKGGESAITEQHPLESVDDDAQVEPSRRYGVDKVRCEQLLQEMVPDQLLILRPGLIVGPRDYTERYTYWVRRLSMPGERLVPGDGRDPVQMIDARDLASFAVELAAARQTGVYNTVGPREPATFADLVEQTLEPGCAVTLRWVSERFLATHDVAPWRDLPCWLPRHDAGGAVERIDGSEAVRAGLQLRPWAETAADIRRWVAASERPPRVELGVSPARERELLGAWMLQCKSSESQI